MPAESFVLDSYALLAILENEPGAQTVADILSEPNYAKFMSVINFGEVLYMTERRSSKKAANQVAEAVLSTDQLKIVVADIARTSAAASLKVRGGLSYADCFAVALAQETGSAVLTGDPEIAAVNEVEIIWLGPGQS